MTTSTTTTHDNPIRRVDLVHHPTFDSKEKKDPYKYGEGVEARPFRYGFASVDRAIERKERLEEQYQRRQKKNMTRNELAETTEDLVKSSSDAANTNSSSNNNNNNNGRTDRHNNNNNNEEEKAQKDQPQKKSGCFENIISFLNPKKHLGAASDEAYCPR